MLTRLARSPRRGIALSSLCAVIAVACSSSASPGTDSAQQLVAAVASFDVSPERTERFIVGLFSRDRGDVALGEVQLSFTYSGDPINETEQSALVVAPGPTAASFLPIPGSEEVIGDEPTFRPPEGVRGVYATMPIRFSVAGV